MNRWVTLLVATNLLAWVFPAGRAVCCTASCQVIGLPETFSTPSVSLINADDISAGIVREYTPRYSPCGSGVRALCNTPVCAAAARTICLTGLASNRYTSSSRLFVDASAVSMVGEQPTQDDPNACSTYDPTTGE